MKTLAHAAGCSAQRSDTSLPGQAGELPGHGARRDAATGMSGSDLLKQPEALPANNFKLTRQLLRQLGFNEIRRQCRLRFPLYNRHEINQLARKLHDEAWKDRDKEAVERAKRPKIDDEIIKNMASAMVKRGD